MRNHDQPDAVRAQYGTTTGLQARQQLHARFTRAEQPFSSWVFDHIPLRPGARVLECGCGNGALWQYNADRLPQGMHVALTDFSESMLAAAQAVVPRDFLIRPADIQALPFADGAFDIVVANHMLYHVPDIDRAISEARRVLAPGGTLICSTIGDENLLELWQLCTQIDPTFQAPTLSFTLENGATYLRKAFPRVAVAHHPSSLYVTDAQAIRDYLVSMDSFTLVMTDTLDALTQQLEARIATEGGIFIRKSAGLFRCDTD